MAEFTSIPVQTVTSNQNVLLTETAVCGNRWIKHRVGAGLISLSGVPCNIAKYKVTAYANIAIPTGGTVEPISLAISVNGEALASTISTITPAAVAQFGNIATGAVISVPCDCCVQVALKNINTQSIQVQNTNVIVERIA